MRVLQIHQDAENERVRHQRQERQEEEKKAAEQLEKQVQMLPSPASSAGSTPKSVDGSSNATAPTAPPAPAPPRRPEPQSVEQREVRPPGHINLAHHAQVNINTVGPFRSQASGLYEAKKAVDIAGRVITLPIMAKHYPRTFARMVYSSLSINDEHEPDFDDEEGELFWPGQVVGSEGLGWICYMGRAMIKEYAKQYGYKGVDGALPLPPGYHNPEDPRNFPLPQTQEPAAEAAAPSR